MLLVYSEEKQEEEAVQTSDGQCFSLQEYLNQHENKSECALAITASTKIKIHFIVSLHATHKVNYTHLKFALLTIIQH